MTLSPKTLTVLRYYDLTSLPEVMQFSPQQVGLSAANPTKQMNCWVSFLNPTYCDWLMGGCWGEEEDQTTIPGIQWKQERDHWTEWRKALQKAGR